MKYPDCNLIDCNHLRNILDYNPKTGIFTWVIPPSSHPRMKGMVAGCNTDGYIKIQIGKRKYFAHRLAWLHYFGMWPSVIDHINRDPSDNRIENLRQCTAAQNTRNHSKRFNRSGLPTGVRLTRSSGKYQARVTFDGKQIHLGAYETPQLAESAYKAKRAELYKEFAPQ